jgi:hypothetical protein
MIKANVRQIQNSVTSSESNRPKPTGQRPNNKKKNKKEQSVSHHKDDETTE